MVPRTPIHPSPRQKKAQKEDEYPRIDWQNLTDPDIQAATILYNDRINTWRRMKLLDEQLETAPTEQAVKEMAELRIRNLQAFAELRAFNDKGKFLCKHPLLYGRSEFAKLLKLLKADPAEFLRRHKNVLDNIKRYKAHLKRDDRKAYRQSDKENLARHEEKERLFQMVMEQSQQAS